MDLSTIFNGAPLTQEAFEAAIAAAGIKLADLSGGEYVAAGKLTSANATIKKLQGDLKAANETIEGFAEVDEAGLKKQIDEWKEKYEEAQKDVQAREYLAILDKVVAEEKFTSNAAKKAFLADLEKQGLTIKGETLLGYNDFKAEYIKEDPTAFIDPTKPAPDGADGTAGIGTGDHGKKLTAADFKKAGMKARMELKEKDPTLYAQLREAAKKL